MMRYLWVFNLYNLSHHFAVISILSLDYHPSVLIAKVDEKCIYIGLICHLNFVSLEPQEKSLHKLQKELNMKNFISTCDVSFSCDNVKKKRKESLGILDYYLLCLLTRRTIMGGDVSIYLESRRLIHNKWCLLTFLLALL